LAPEKQGHYLEVIRQQAQRMDGSVRQMLELSRLETGAKALRRTAFSLAELAQERLQAALPTDSTIHTKFAAQGKFEVNADRALLTRALDALLENAVQHTPEGGCITVHLADGVLSVTNTGDAIPADALPRLWEVYYQADPSRSAKGDGLGLSSRKPCSICWLHLWAENTEIGPKFWFRFADK
ncbi:MAG: sensor histidine kinase, partial [Butyricicoccus sp.]